MAWEPDYVDREALKHYLTQGQQGVTDTLDDDELDLAVTAASRAVDRECGRHRPRQFGILGTAEARWYTARFDSEGARWVAEIDDLMDLTGVAIAIDVNQDDVHEASVTTGFVWRPRNAASLLRPYTQVAFSRSGTQPMQWPDAVKITAKWGWSAVPVTIKQATMLQASRIFSRRNAPFGTKGSPDDGSDETLRYNADPDVKLLLRSFVKLVETP